MTEKMIIYSCERVERIFHYRSNSLSPPFFFVYLYMIHDLVMKLPFSEFAYRVLTKAFVAPSQLHPNAWVFVCCFEVLADYFRFEATTSLFFFFLFYKIDQKRSK